MSVSKQRFKDLANRFVNDTFNEFNQSYTFESLTETPDGSGNYDVQWNIYAEITGFVKIASANEIILDDHLKTKEIKKFSFEYVSGLNTDMRILYDGYYYNVHSIDPVQDSDVWIDVMAYKDVAV